MDLAERGGVLRLEKLERFNPPGKESVEKGKVTGAGKLKDRLGLGLCQVHVARRLQS